MGSSVKVNTRVTELKSVFVYVCKHINQHVFAWNLAQSNKFFHTITLSLYDSVSNQCWTGYSMSFKRP